MGRCKGDTCAMPIDRLARRSEVVGDCWVWRGWVDAQGYGYFKADGRTIAVHRYAYLYLVGPIPDGLNLDHLCRVHACWNPDCLDPVPGVLNRARGAEWRRAQHLLGADCGHAWCVTCGRHGLERAA